MTGKPRIVVCVPARNEAERLPILLETLAHQDCPATILIALNNTTDSSVDAIERVARRFQQLEVAIDETTFIPDDAHAGSARRRAMDLGAQMAGGDGILITTDADTRPPTNWISENVAALECGLDIVGGRIVLDEAEALAEPISRRMAATGVYWSTVRAIEDAIDPVPWDPPPRHGDHTGASLALRVADYVACGGVPLLASGEDRALVQAVCSKGGKLGHPSRVWTRVSARTAGRARSGMADAMAKLADDLQHGAPTMLPNYRHWEQRARWRKAIRERFGSADIVAREAALPPMPCDMALAAGGSNDPILA